MEQTQPPPATTPAPPPSQSTSTPQPPAEQPQQQLPPPPSPPLQPPSSTTTTQLTTPQPVPSQNPISATKPTSTTTPPPIPSQITRQHPLQQPYNRPWPPQQLQQPQPSPFQHFVLPPTPAPPPPHPSPSSSVTTQNPRGGNGGMAMGVPAHHHHPLTPPPPSFTHQFARNLPESLPPASTTSQVRQSLQGMHGMGMMGSLGSNSSMRPAGAPPQQLRSISSSLRPQTNTSNQSVVTQNFQGHGMLRVQSVGFPSSQSHTTASQSPRSQNQPWLAPGQQGKPPLPTPALRPQVGTQSLHQRPHILSHSSSAQQSQPSTSSQAQGQDHLGQQMAPSRIQPLGRGQGSGIQRPPSHAFMQSTMVKPGLPPSKAPTLGMEEPGGRILSKRSIQEIVTQIDPSEKLDAEVEDILIDVAEEFVESITTFGCSLAKHRKSNTLEAKDILLHLERNWNMTLPGFSGDEIRIFKKPFTSDIHKERIAAIKKSALAAETTNAKGSAQGGGNMKSHLAKGPANFLGSPNAKT